MSIWTVITTIITALLSGGLVGAVLRYRIQYPKAVAEAKKLDYEADDTHIAALERVITSLERRMNILELEIADCHKDRELALTTARFLWDRLNTVSPSDEVLEPLRQYLARPPVPKLTRDMQDKLDELP